MVNLLSNLSKFDILFSIFLLSLPLGSFYNVVALRTLSGESFMAVEERSHCNSCGHQLHWNDLIPVVSWLLLKGKCRYCSAKIPGMYSLWEFFTALSYTTIVYMYGFSIETLVHIILITIMIWSAVTDYEERRIPKQFLIAGYILIVLLGLFTNGLIFGVRMFMALLGVMMFAASNKIVGDSITQDDLFLYGLVILGSGFVFGTSAFILGSFFAGISELAGGDAVDDTEVDCFVPFFTWAVFFVHIIFYFLPYTFI